MINTLPSPLTAVIAEKLRMLFDNDRYLAAFIFDLHDPFIKVIVNEDNCINLSHTRIGDEYIGVSFVSFAQFEDALRERKKDNRRHSMLDNAQIVFDKTGILQMLREKYHADQPVLPGINDYPNIRFSIQHADNKITYAITNGDELSAQMGFHVGVNDLVKAHYRLQGHWFVNDKWIFRDLRQWDPVLAELLADFLSSVNIAVKHAAWKKMIIHVLAPIGGKLDPMESNCVCKNCVEDLDFLQ